MARTVFFFLGSALLMVAAYAVGHNLGGKQGYARGHAELIAYQKTIAERRITDDRAERAKEGARYSQLQKAYDGKLKQLQKLANDERHALDTVERLRAKLSELSRITSATDSVDSAAAYEERINANNKLQSAMAADLERLASAGADLAKEADQQALDAEACYRAWPTH